MRKRSIVIIIASMLSAILIYITHLYLNEQRLDIYTMTNDGRLIIKDNIEYETSGIVSDEVRGRGIGKMEYNAEKYHIFEEKGKNIHDYIIAIGNDIGVNEEFKNKNIESNK